MSSLCFNSFLNNNIHVEGIKDIDKDDISYAKKLGYKIKLLGYAELIGKHIFQRVHPTLIRKEFLCCKHRWCFKRSNYRWNSSRSKHNTR